MSVLLIAYYRKALGKWIPSHFLFTCIDSDSVTLGVKLIERLRWAWSPLKHLTIKILLLTFILIKNAQPNNFWEAVIWLCHFKMINKFNCIHFSLFPKGATMEKGLYIHRNANRFSVNRGLTRSVWLTNFLSLCVSLWMIGHCKLKMLAKLLYPTAWADDRLFLPHLDLRKQRIFKFKVQKIKILIKSEVKSTAWHSYYQ